MGATGTTSGILLSSVLFGLFNYGGAEVFSAPFFKPIWGWGHFASLQLNLSRKKANAGAGTFCRAEPALGLNFGLKFYKPT